MMQDVLFYFAAVCIFEGNVLRLRLGSLLVKFINSIIIADFSGGNKYTYKVGVYLPNSEVHDRLN